MNSIAELRAAARKRLPGIVFEYIEGGAEDEVTLRANRTAFHELRSADVSQRSGATTLFGRRYDSPFGIAPLGAAGLCWHDAEIALARAARGANVPFILSMHSLAPLERVAARSGTTPWFQLYMPKGRGIAARLVRRAFDVGCEALVLTTDVPVGGNRGYGLGFPMKLGPRAIIDGLLHPRWLTSVYLRRNWEIPAHWNERRDTQSWDDLAWLRREWPRKLLVKGILSPHDARRAVDLGVDGIVVSNHGGRQLDGAAASIDALPAITAAVGKQTTLILDSGVRGGADIVKALALGAHFALVGRAALYGVAAAGEDGARRALRILRTEVDRALFGADVGRARDGGEDRDLVAHEPVELFGRRRARLDAEREPAPARVRVGQNAR